MDNKVANTAVWFEIPATEFKRAVKFYHEILDVEMHEEKMDGLLLGLFPHDKTSVSGAIIYGMDFKPNKDGSIVYLNGGDDLSTALSKVEDAGGQVIIPKTHLGDEIGYIAHFIDTEGNRVGLHSLH
ncbi:MAG: VOC family protein [Gammaproteobacteria bacterium]|nr:VOC family protein [Gammaproteobacteria bacterium]